MARPEPPIRAFRRRLLQFIAEQYGGRYTALAHRAGIPVSTMQHYVHSAKHLPGGEHLLRMAAALGVTVQDLITGPEAGRPTTRLVPPAPVVPARAEQPGRPGLTTPWSPAAARGRVRSGQRGIRRRSARRWSSRPRCFPNARRIGCSPRQLERAQSQLGISA